MLKKVNRLFSSASNGDSIKEALDAVPTKPTSTRRKESTDSTSSSGKSTSTRDEKVSGRKSEERRLLSGNSQSTGEAFASGKSRPSTKSKAGQQTNELLRTQLASARTGGRGVGASKGGAKPSVDAKVLRGNLDSLASLKAGDKLASGKKGAVRVDRATVAQGLKRTVMGGARQDAAALVLSNLKDAAAAGVGREQLDKVRAGLQNLATTYKGEYPALGQLAQLCTPERLASLPAGLEVTPDGKHLVVKDACGDAKAFKSAINTALGEVAPERRSEAQLKKDMQHQTVTITREGGGAPTSFKGDQTDPADMARALGISGPASSAVLQATTIATADAMRAGAFKAGMPAQADGTPTALIPTDLRKSQVSHDVTVRKNGDVVVTTTLTEPVVGAAGKHGTVRLGDVPGEPPQPATITYRMTSTFTADQLKSQNPRPVVSKPDWTLEAGVEKTPFTHLSNRDALTGKDGLIPTHSGVVKDGWAHHLTARVASGGFGTVYRGESSTGQVVALKVPKGDRELEEDLSTGTASPPELPEAAAALHEDVAGLRTARERGVDRAAGYHGFGAVVDGSGEVTSVLAMELVQGKTLTSVMGSLSNAQKRAPANEHPREFKQRQMAMQHLMRSTVEALAQMHDAGIMHRDIKPENLMYEPTTGKVRVVDLGLATMESEVTGVAGTLRYMAPEVKARETYNRKADVFSTGATLKHVQDVVAPSVQTGGPPVTAIDKFMGALTQMDPSQRPDLRQLLFDPSRDLPKTGTGKDPMATDPLAFLKDPLGSDEELLAAAKAIIR